MGNLKVRFDEQEWIGVTRQTNFCILYEFSDLMIDTIRHLAINGHQPFWSESKKKISQYFVCYQDLNYFKT